LKLGLVDGIGGYQKAIEVAKEEAGLKGNVINIFKDKYSNQIFHIQINI
jgi:ClpP class serine protease